MAGIAPSNFWRILAAVKEGTADPLGVALSEEMDAAEHEYQQRMLGKVTAAAGDDWRAAAWILERRFPREFCRNVHAHATLMLEDMLECLRGQMTPEAFVEVARALVDAQRNASRRGTPRAVPGGSH
jgi:hypothetical protein